MLYSQGQVRFGNISDATALTDEQNNLPSRRTFLTGGAAALLLAAAAGTQGRTQALIGTPPLKRNAPESLFPPIAVGYWNAQQNTVMTAARLTQGDPRLVENGVRITIHGRGLSSATPQIADCTLLAHFLTEQEGSPIKFNAWKYRNDGLQSYRSPVSFYMPISQTNEITFSMVYPWKIASRRGSALAATEVVEDTIRLSLVAGNGKLKLQTGTYFLALPDPESNALPPWDACRFLPEYAAETLMGGTLCISTSKGLKPVTYPYMILSITPEDPEEEALPSS